VQSSPGRKRAPTLIDAQVANFGAGTSEKPAAPCGDSTKPLTLADLSCEKTQGGVLVVATRSPRSATLLFPDRRPALTTVDASIHSDFRSVSSAREGFVDDLVIRHPESLSEFYLANADIEHWQASPGKPRSS
jgi:hypothetical protein